MSRSVFFLITAIVSVLFGAMSLLAPANVIKGYGFEPSPEKTWMFRIFGGMILSAGFLNFLVRNQTDLSTVQAVLIFNIIFYLIRLANDGIALYQRLFVLKQVVIGELIHVFICGGSLVYLLAGDD